MGWHGVGIGILTEPTCTTGSGPAAGATSDDQALALAPNFTAGPTGLDPYRPWHVTILDGLLYVVNGYDLAQRWDGGTNFYPLGAAAPTTFTLADATGGTTFPAGRTVRYRLCYRTAAIAKETCPQLAGASDPFFDEGAVGVSHTMVGNKDILISWTDPALEFDEVAIYRALDGTDTYFLVATVNIGTLSYTDSRTDADLISDNNDYTRRFRTTLPPRFYGITSHLNRLWGWVEGESKLSYSQTASITGELLQEDFPPLNILPIAPEDGAGDIWAARPHYDSLFVFKRRACYEVLGDDPAIFVVRRMYADRGVLNPRCIVDTEGFMVILDDRGLYLWTPGGEPLIAGVARGSQESRLEPIWNRMNLSASSLFHVEHDRPNRLIKAWIALDYEPVPNTRIVYDYANNRFTSVDTTVWSSAAGDLTDAYGKIHEIHADDLGYFWEENIGQSQGVTTGDLSGTVTGGDGLGIDCSAASFDVTIDGVVGAPYLRGASGSEAVDTNRVYAATSASITPYYYSSDSVDAGEILTLGAIPFVAQTPKLNIGTGEKKDIKDAVVEFDSGPDGTLTVATARDDDSFVTKKNVDLSTNVRDIVPCNDSCWTWSLRLSQNAAQVGVSVRGLRLKLRTFPDRT